MYITIWIFVCLFIAFIISIGIGLAGGISAFFVSLLLLGCFGGFVGIIGGLIHSSIVENNHEKVNVEFYSRNIASLEDNTEVNGEFFLLGTGYIDTEMKYYFMMEQDGGYVFTTVNAKEVIIKEIPKGQQPRFVKTGDIVKDLEIRDKTSATHQNVKKFLYVPEGTIKKSYNIDLKK